VAVIGELVVNVKANTGEFNDGMGKARVGMKDFGEKGEEAGEKIKTSMYEARGGLMMTEHILGVPLPRHLNSLIAKIPMVGAAFATMLPIIGIVLAIEIIEKLIAKHDAALAKIKEVKDAWDEVHDGERKVGEEILTLQAETDELNGQFLKALQERLKVLDEQTLDKLTEQFKKLETAADKTFTSMRIGWLQIWLGSGGTNEFVDKAKADIDDLFHHVQSMKDAGKSTNDIGEMLKAQADIVAHDLITKDLSKEETAAKQKELEIMRDMTKEYTAQKTLEDLKVKKETSDEDKKIYAAAEAKYREEKAIYDAQQRGQEERRRAEEHYTEERKKAKEKEIKEAERLEEEEVAATKAVTSAYEKVQLATQQEQLRYMIEYAKLQDSAETDAARHRLAMHQATRAQTEAADLAAAKREQETEMLGYNTELNNLNSMAVKDVAKIQELNDKKLLAEKKYQMQRQRIIEKSEEESEKIVRQCEERMADAVAQNVAKSIVENKNMGAAFKKTGEEMLENLMMNVMKSIMIHNTEKMDAARTAGSKAYEWASGAGPIIATAVGLAAMAECLAFAEGGLVPGSGDGDTVPAMLTPGETVVTKALTQQVADSQSGNNRRATTHIHPTFAPTIHAMDAEGVDRVLEKHSAKFEKHFQRVMRKANR
jgi:hypothetical protein